MELGVMAMKGYFTFPKAPRLESQHHMQFRVISRTFWGQMEIFSLYRATVDILWPQPTSKLFPAEIVWYTWQSKSLGKSVLLYSRIQIYPDLQFHSKTYTWLEKGSIWPDVSLTAAAETINKMCLCARDSAQGFQARIQEINSH